LESLLSAHIETRLGRLWTQESGAGPVLVLLHGILSDNSSWYSLVPALAARHRVLLIDGPGHGQSDPAPAGVTLEAYTEAIAEVLDAKGVDDAVFIGLSLGGMVAQRLALQHPGRVRGLLLLGTTADGPTWAVRARFWLTGNLIGRFGMAAPLRKNLAGWVFPPEFLARRPDMHDLMAARYAAWDARKTRRVFEGLFKVQGIREDLVRVSAPTLVMVGALDRVAPPAFSEAIARAIPGARLVVMPDIGHVVPIEAPEAFLSELDAFEATLVPPAVRPD
jgi:3-oxoadipate enol-lactonase